MDEADVANDMAAQMLQASLDEAAFQLRQEKAQPFTGKCLYCGDPVADLVRFCGEDCSEDHRWIAESRKRRGLA